MIDFGFDKLALIGAVALIVIGPKKLPRVARTIGHLVGNARRYVADVKAEVSRSIELEDLKKMQSEFTDAAHDVQRSVSKEFERTKTNLSASLCTTDGSLSDDMHEALCPQYTHPNKRWRLKRSAVPRWYKQRNGVRGTAQSGAARVARFRRPRTTA